jgi:hypothetical protein
MRGSIEAASPYAAHAERVHFRQFFVAGIGFVEIDDAAPDRRIELAH